MRRPCWPECWSFPSPWSMSKANGFCYISHPASCDQQKPGGNCSAFFATSAHKHGSCLPAGQEAPPIGMKFGFFCLLGACQLPGIFANYALRPAITKNPKEITVSTSPLRSIKLWGISLQAGSALAHLRVRPIRPQPLCQAYFCLRYVNQLSFQIALRAQCLQRLIFGVVMACLCELQKLNHF